MMFILDQIKKRLPFLKYVLLKLSVVLLGFISNILIVRKLSISDYGSYTVILALVGLITTFGFSWSSSSILYYGSRELNVRNKLNRTFWARNVIMSATLVLVIFLYTIFYKNINSYLGIDYSWILLLWLFTVVVEDYLVQFYLTIHKQTISSIVSITAKLFLLAIVLIFNFDIKMLIWINVISHATVIFYVFGLNRKFDLSFDFEKSWFKEVLKFSLWQLFGFSGLYLINFGDTIVIKEFLAEEDIAIYNVGYKLFNTFASFAFVISSFFAASITENIINQNGDKIRSFYYKERLIILALALVGHVLLFFISKHLILLFYGDRYLGSVIVFNILLVGSFFRYISVFYTLFYNVTQKYVVLQTVNIFRAIINIGLDIILVQRFGIIGPAIATVLAILITLSFSIIYCEPKIMKLSKRGS